MTHKRPVNRPSYQRLAIAVLRFAGIVIEVFFRHH
jgi:hypothetical protein